MKKFLLAFVLPLPMLAAAQSPFNGTWKVNLNQANFSPKPDVYVLAKGMYSCNTCAPPYTVKADGSDQAVKGHPYFDTVAVTVVNDHQIKEVDKKGGKVVATSTETVSGDGKTVTFEFSDASNTNGGAPVTGKGSATRVAAGPAGSHAISGSWKMGKIANLSDNAIVFSYQVNGNQVTMKAQTGQSYTAKLDGSDAPMQGDPGVSSVTVKMLGKNVLEEDDKRNGKVILVSKTTLAADGKTGKVVNTDLLTNRTATFEIVKQ